MSSNISFANKNTKRARESEIVPIQKATNIDEVLMNQDIIYQNQKKMEKWISEIDTRDYSVQKFYLGFLNCLANNNSF